MSTLLNSSHDKNLLKILNDSPSRDITDDESFDICNELEHQKIDSKYVPLEDLSKYIKTAANISNEFITLHINIRSIPKNYDNLKLLLAKLSDMQIRPDAILLCETFLTDISNKLFPLPHYTFIGKN